MSVAPNLPTAISEAAVDVLRAALLGTALVPGDPD